MLFVTCEFDSFLVGKIIHKHTVFNQLMTSQ